MKGGKAGRDRRNGAAAPGQRSGGRGAAKSGAGKPGAAKRPANAPPRKGSRKKPDVGGTSSAGDD